MTNPTPAPSLDLPPEVASLLAVILQALDVPPASTDCYGELSLYESRCGTIRAVLKNVIQANVLPVYGAEILSDMLRNYMQPRYMTLDAAIQEDAWQTYVRAGNVVAA